MTTSRWLWLACAVWLVSTLSSAPAAERASSESAKRPHQDLSLFTTSQDCVACHNNLTTPAGEDVSIGSSWRSTMMANSARDPYWHAGVRRETMDHPAHAAAIQDECAACHMPMAQRVAKASGSLGEVFSHLPIAGNDNGSPKLHALAADGISC